MLDDLYVEEGVSAKESDGAVGKDFMNLFERFARHVNGQIGK